MSAYEKSSQASVLDFQTSSALHDPSVFAAYVQPPYAPHFIFPAGPEADHLHYLSGSDSRTQHGLQEQRSAVTDPRTHPEIRSCSPQHGVEGSTVQVVLRTLHDLLAPPSISISLSFASKRVDGVVELLGGTNDLFQQYAVSARVPPFISTGWHSFTVPLRLVMDGGHAASVPQFIEVGAFRYSGQVAEPSQLRKRKASPELDEISQPLPKKAAIQQLRLQDHNGEQFHFHQSATSPYSPFLPTPTAGTVFQPGHHQTASPRISGHRYSSSNVSQASITAPSPHTPAWSPTFTTVTHTSHTPVPPMTPAARQSATSSPVKQANPTLMRTSTIQQSPGALVPPSAALGQFFNPYAMYPLKAVLKLNGDLDAMAEGWNLEEFEARRRLVQFTRHQNGSTIHADFKSIAPEDRPPNSITISCIWWEEKKECFVTSVDTIYLLEALVAVRFTVEEKNRIRRNLEGFRPLTVSKAKADSEDFFKTIMGFPNPKPRNIEKDVKVFPWKILAHALKKIISKYSASYSSTASAILTPASSTYASTESSMDHHSPSGLDGVAASASFPPTIMYSPDANSGRISAPVNAGPADLRLQVATTEGSYVPGAYGIRPQTMPQVSMPHTQGPMSQVMSAPVSRMPSWDFAHFIDTSPASTQAGIPSLPCSRPHHGVDASNFMPTTAYSMAPPSSGI